MSDKEKPNNQKPDVNKPIEKAINEDVTNRIRGDHSAIKKISNSEPKDPIIKPTRDKAD